MKLFSLQELVLLGRAGARLKECMDDRGDFTLQVSHVTAQLDIALCALDNSALCGKITTRLR